MLRSSGLQLDSRYLPAPSNWFSPIAIILVALASRQCRSTAVSNSALVLFVSILVPVPWATRNYLVFDELVPVRTGSGQIGKRWRVRARSCGRTLGTA